MKNVAIVAAGHGRDRAPFKNPEWECWGVNATWSNWGDEAEALFDRWFELHRRSYLRWEHAGDRGYHFRWLRSLRTLPVYVQDMADWPDVPTARAYPWEQVERLSKVHGKYHACSIDWMLALAIKLGAKKIDLYGVEQEHTQEPIGSRACVEFWSGFATGKGIEVRSAAGSTFKVAHLVYTDVPYAVDPEWLPFEDRTHGGQNDIGRLRDRLRRTVRGEPSIE